jgi:predicted ATPase/DNA-binding winged helix-turn-helix (wHTH) protein
MAPSLPRSAGIAFGQFEVFPDRREMLVDGRPIKLGGRAFDVLMALIDAHGGVISKDALMARVWPGQIVEENSLAAQIGILRRTLGTERERIRTISGRGYQFRGDIRVAPARTGEVEDDTGIAVPSRPVLPPTNVPESVSELIGRDKELADVLDLVEAHRLVSLNGAGGIGKTRLALAAARRLLPEFADGIWKVEFSGLAGPDLVPATVAAAIGLQPGGGEISPQLVSQALAHRRLLLILDTCEHVIDAAAAMAEALLQAGPGVRIIATSREPLRAEGERIYQVPPLTLPAEEVEDPWRFGAVQLFVTRSRASGAHVSEDHHTAPVIAGICRRLDGVPLAIELAAGLAPTLGIETLAGRLEDIFDLLTGGRRTALPRHQTLRATFDWSYELLIEPERVVLLSLAVFAGAFDLAAASTVAASSEIPSPRVVRWLSALVAKSLVVAEIEGAHARYRLLDTTRAYALEKLHQSGERERLLRRHAEYYRHLFEQAEVEWETRPALEWLRDYGWCIDNLRAALDWAFSPAGDASIGVALTAAAIPLWTHLSLLSEFRGRAEQAFAARKNGDGGDPHAEMKLYIALTGSSFWSSADAWPRIVDRELGVLWTKALEVGESLDDVDYQLRALWGLNVFHIGMGDFQIALEMGQRFRGLATKQRRRNDELIGVWMVGNAQHMLGDHASARRNIEQVLANFILPDLRFHYIKRFSVDQRLAARIYHARILWFQGFPDEAVRIVKETVHEAIELNHAVSLCYTLDFAACPIMLWVGDDTATEQYIAMLADYSARYALPLWSTLSRAFQALLLIRRGDFGSGIEPLRVDWDNFGTRPGWIALFFLNELAAGFATAGQTAEGLAAIEQAIARAERTDVRWAFPESLRIKGELLLSQGATGAENAAEDHFRQALDWARRQGALSLELRAATSFARLLRDQGSAAEAKTLLQPVCDRFTEGFATADMNTARALLDRL